MFCRYSSSCLEFCFVFELLIYLSPLASATNVYLFVFLFEFFYCVSPILSPSLTFCLFLFHIHSFYLSIYLFMCFYLSIYLFYCFLLIALICLSVVFVSLSLSHSRCSCNILLIYLLTTYFTIIPTYLFIMLN